MTEYPIEVRNLTKTFGAVRAVNDLTFTAHPGRVTGFLGPNGAGKSTTLRALLALVRPTSGSATIGGRHYAQIERPASLVGAHFEGSFHPGRTARDHLRVFAPLVGVDDARCDEVLAQVGMQDAANRRAGGYSMGMRQRLGLATALLGNPRVLVLDESANGLDPAGIKWLRGFLRAFADEGGTVLLSSHLLSEVQQTVDDVVIIAAGELRYQGSLDDLRHEARSGAVVRSPDGAALKKWVRATWGDKASLTTRTEAHIEAATAAEVGAAAHAAGLEVHYLADVGEDLETTFLRLTKNEAVGAVGGMEAVA